MTSTAVREAPADLRSRFDRYAPWIVFGFTVLTAALRIDGLDQSFFGDELFTYQVAGQERLGEVLAQVRSQLEITPPLFFILAWGFGKVGDPFVWLRVVSVICSTATVPLLYLLGKRTMGRAAGVVAGGFWALSPMTIFYGIEARAYALMNMLVVLAALSMLAALRTRDRRWWAAVSLTYAASMYSHYTCVFVLAALAGWALVTHRDQWRALVISMGAAALLFVPWIPSMLADLDSPNQKVYNALMPATPKVVLEESVRALTQGPYLPVSLVPVILVGAAGVIALVGLVVRGRPIPATTWLLIAMSLAAPVGLLVQSVTGDDMYAARNLTSSLPAAYLLLAGLLVALPRAWAVIGLTCAFAGLAIGAARGMQAANERPQFAQVAEFIEQRNQPGDRVVEVMPFTGPPATALQVHIDPSLPFTQVSVPSQLPQAMTTARHFVVLAGSDAPPIPGYRMVESQHWPGLVEYLVAVYEPVR